MTHSIKAIDKQTVHRICSGQVVLTLAVAVKELIENSLDAGASVIDVRIKEYGSELIEVLDNGSGVEESNFEGLALKHHTSKLKEFSDLTNVETFGFRGEALSSLCALSDITMTTSHKASSCGFRLQFDHNGVLVEKTPCARQVGMTVTVKNLFMTLPVRHKEFLRNLRREFTKMIQLLTAYCLICKDTRITCVNQVGGRKSTVLTTNGSTNTRENIVSVFGSKQVSTLLELKPIPPEQQVQEEYQLTSSEVENIPFHLSGFVSSCEHGKGRSSADRQFFFINDRPCDLPKVSKIMNEVYHSYNRHQYPFILLNVGLNKDEVDINVTPDKRQIFIQYEKLLLATLKSSLMQLYESLPAVVSTSNLLNNRSLLTSFEKLQTKRKFSEINEIAGNEGDQSDSEVSLLEMVTPNDRDKLFTEIIPRDTKQLGDDKHDFSKISTNKIKHRKVMKDNCCGRNDCSPLEKLLSFQRNSECGLDLSQFSNKSPTKRKIKPTSSYSITSYYRTQDSKDHKHSTEMTGNNSLDSENRKLSADVATCSSDSLDGCVISECEVPESTKCFPTSPEVSTEHKGFESPASNQLITRVDEIDEAEVCCDVEMETTFAVELDVSSPAEDLDTSPLDEGSDEEITASCSDVRLDEPGKTESTRTVIAQFSLEELKKQIASEGEKDSEKGPLYRLFRAKIDPSESSSAEDELRKELKKDMFSKMEIIGQFNLGFIIVKLGSDLFIVDQHATDEKYNYEMLQKDRVLDTQKLVVPQALHLTAMNESILLENIEILRKNGFHFNICDDVEPGHKIQLVSVPVSRNWTFGKDDIEELVFMLSDSPGVMCRPSRVSQMFASRACRKSVMIGTSLSQADMKKLIIHMGEIEQPWNCPHGRPTIRHLLNLNMVCNADLPRPS